jgi:catechol 2,3-dioxygenase-like lactoylglutathione lyase family enzyme
MSSTQTETAVQAEALKATGIGLAVTANDFQKSLAWYQNVLGFSVQFPYERDGVTFGASIVCGNARISLNQDDGKKGLNRVKGQGSHFYFQTDQDVDAVAAHAKSAGGEITEGPSDKPWGVRSFSTLDPDGFLITVSRPLGG